MWPTLAELKRTLGISPSVTDRDALLSRALAAAITGVKLDTKDAYEEPDIPAPLQQAALFLAVKAAKAPEAPFGVAAVFDSGGLYVSRTDPVYRRLLKGFWRSFGVA